MEIAESRGTVDYRLETVAQSQLRATRSYEGINRSLAEFTPVLALTLTRNCMSEVMVAVRDPQSNQTHPDVLSSPTARIRGISDEAILSLPLGSATLDSLPSWLPENAEAIMRSKLETECRVTADMIVDIGAWQGRSIIGTNSVGRLVSEPLTMINVHIELPDTVAYALPGRSASYRAIRWVAVEDHARVVSLRNARACDADFGQPAPIVYGLCNMSTAGMLQRAVRSNPLLVLG